MNYKSNHDVKSSAVSMCLAEPVIGINLQRLKTSEYILSVLITSKDYYILHMLL